MDSASSIAQRTAGEQRLETGFFTFAMETNTAEKVAILRRSRPYRDVHRRSSHGEGRPA